MAKHQPADSPPVAEIQHFSNAYELFILLLTFLSLADMALLLLPRLAPQTRQLLQTYDLLFCILFLFDFGMRLKRARSRRRYFFRQGGIFDLLGSVPSLGFFRFTALLRLCRISRIVRAIRMLRSQKKGGLWKDVLANRGQYAGFITVVLAATVLGVSSVLEVQAESRARERHHHDRRRCPVVGDRHHHHGGLRRHVPGDRGGARRRRVRHGRRRRGDRRAGLDPGQRPDPPADSRRPTLRRSCAR